MLLSVTDHGPGIPEADRKHAVERFVRLEASRTLPGSGLGLSLASAVATLHGGELRLGDAHPGLVRDAGDPGARGPATGLRLKRRMCHRRWHDLIRAGQRGPTWSGRALRGRTACRSRPTKPNNVSQTGSPSLSRRSRLRSTRCSSAFRTRKRSSLGIAESSPYLFDLIRADAARLIRLLRLRSGPHLAALIERTSRAVRRPPSEADAMHLLRRMKAEAALLIALCDIGGVWPVMQVTAALTDLAVAVGAVGAALSAAAGGRARPH